MTEVWIATERDYETIDILGVFADNHSAREFCRRRWLEDHPSISDVSPIWAVPEGEDVIVTPSRYTFNEYMVERWPVLS